MWPSFCSVGVGVFQARNSVSKVYTRSITMYQPYINVVDTRYMLVYNERAIFVLFFHFFFPVVLGFVYSCRYVQIHNIDGTLQS